MLYLPQVSTLHSSLPVLNLTKNPYAELVSSFLSGKNKLTIEALKADIGDFQSFIGADSLEDAAKKLLSSSQGQANFIALKYKGHLVEKGLASNTINRRLSCLRSLVKLGNIIGIIPFNLQVSNLPASAYRDTRGCGGKGFRALLETAATPKTPKKVTKSIRDQAILHLLFDLSLRRNEVVTLDLKHVDIDNSTVSVLGKGKTERIKLTLPEETKRALSDWIKVRGDEPGALFHHLSPAVKERKRITGTGVYLVIRALGRRAKIGHVWPHSLRHAGITTALDLCNGDVRSVSKYSRHANIQTVMIYDDNRLNVGGDIACMVAKSAMVLS